MVALALAVLAFAAPAPTGPLPDLDELAPAAVSVVPRNGHNLLVFASAAANVGPGALVVEGHRVHGVMQAWQVVAHKRIALGVALQYVQAETHQHWHLLGFERYELRQLGGTPVGHDRKTGFCLRDDIVMPGTTAPAKWAGECKLDQPRASQVREGISVGYADEYAPEKEGQSIDVTGVPAGVYDLVHTVNPDHLLREASYANNDASVRIQLGPGLQVSVLATCPDSATC